MAKTLIPLIIGTVLGIIASCVNTQYSAKLKNESELQRLHLQKLEQILKLSTEVDAWAQTWVLTGKNKKGPLIIKSMISSNPSPELYAVCNLYFNKDIQTLAGAVYLGTQKLIVFVAKKADNKMDVVDLILEATRGLRKLAVNLSIEYKKV